MRPIKFRAWHFTEKKMFYNVYLYPWNMVVDNDDKLIGYSWIDVYLMQSTWLLDKNGKEIYEGGIVKRDDKSNGRYWRFAVVELDPDIQFNCSSINEIDWIKNSADCVFRYGHFAYKDTENYLTIIGNIYETPELVTA